MRVIEKGDIVNPRLAPGGRRKMIWAREHMPVLAQLRAQCQENRPLMGYRIGCCLHLEAKTACLAELLREAGAEVYIVGCNPFSTQDDICAALAEGGITVYAHHNSSKGLYQRHCVQILETRPHLLIDNGASLTSLLHRSHRSLAGQVIGCCEETATGVTRLRALEKGKGLLFPSISINDAESKHLFDNQHGTGQAVWDNINQITNLVIAGKTVVIVGYGWCGKGVARRAQGLGARVVVCEVDPIRALEAHMEGFTILPMQEAASCGHVFVSVTGNYTTIGAEHFERMRDGVILANAGHFDVEIDEVALKRMALREERIRSQITTYTLTTGRRIHLLSRGRLVNLAGGDGHPTETMDVTYSLLVLGVLHLLENRSHLSCRVVPMPEDLDRRVAYQCLKTLGVEMDELTGMQREYLYGYNLSFIR
ncbi:adenosylhomocysteinase [Pasteuria penetrans]|uniref:adenosylhomocysteinase n=1 Tax=Pasteuria penetrans TaxID=86005 RepID=UPI000F92FBCB|nr:adenosylhomocysteinase [Pasteuria penetrans]